VKYATCFFSVNDTHYPVETAPRGQSLIPCYRQPGSSNRRQERHGTGQAPPKTRARSDPVPAELLCVEAKGVLSPHSRAGVGLLCVVSTERRAWNLSASKR